MANSLNKIGNKAIAFIQSNIDNSEDYSGNSFKQYSFEYWMKKNHLFAKAKSKKSKISQIEAYKSAWSASTKVDLTLTGAMRASLGVIDFDENLNTITIGFFDRESASKAFYHNISGAGKGRILRQFLGLQPLQEQDLSGFAAETISKDEDYLKKLLNRAGFEVSD